MQSSVRWMAAVAALLFLSAGAMAEALSTCASGASDVCYMVGVPSATASDTTGNMYIQISAPTTYTWVALGMGTQRMVGANMFIMYTDGAGNVTVSSRQGKGNLQPLYSASTASNVQLLSGSGVSDGKMVANILCVDCKAWDGGSLSTTSTNVGMIGAWKAGAALDSKDLSQTIEHHDGHTVFEADLTKATLASDSNPFIAAATTPQPTSGTGSTTGTGGSTSSTGSPGTSGVTVKAPPNPKVIWAHGVGMCLVFGVFYPFGSALMPLLGKWRLHAGIQMTSWLGMWAFFGLGVYGAQERHLLFDNTHTLLGTVVVCLLAVQPALGQLHHLNYVKTGARGIVSYLHLWWGRILLVLGAINAGLGFQLADEKQRYIIAYSLVTVFFYVLWVAVKVFARMRKGKQVGGGRKASSGTAVSADDEMPMNDFSSGAQHKA